MKRGRGIKRVSKKSGISSREGWCQWHPEPIVSGTSDRTVPGENGTKAERLVPRGMKVGTRGIDSGTRDTGGTGASGTATRDIRGPDAASVLRF